MSESCGGGGSAPSSGWGKKDDEDDWKFAHRCTQMAHSMASLNHAAEVFTDKSITIWLSEKASIKEGRKIIFQTMPLIYDDSAVSVPRVAV